MRNTQVLLSILVVFVFFPVVALGQIIVSVSPNPVSVGVGSQATFDIVLTPLAGETFDAFTLAFAVGDGGSATGSPQDGDNLLITGLEIGPLFEGTDFTAVVTAGGIGQSAVLINFNQADVSDNILADGVVATITVDSSSANLLDTFALNTNILGATAFFDDGTPLDFDARLTALEVVDPVLLGDANQDGLVNFLDINPFIVILAANDFLAEVDVNQDGVVDFLDIAPFIGLLAGNR